MVIRCDGRPLSAILASERDREERRGRRGGSRCTAVARVGPEHAALALGRSARARACERTHRWRRADSARGSERRLPVVAVAGASRPADERERRDEPPFDNGIGGLNADGDYEIRSLATACRRRRGSNVIANPHGGFIVSETRGGVHLGREQLLLSASRRGTTTPCRDPASDVLYLRDEGTGDVWSATPAPVVNGDVFTVTPRRRLFHLRHRARRHRHRADGRAWPPTTPVKLSLLRMTNRGDAAAAPHRHRVTWNGRWACMREQTQHHVRTRFDRDTSAILARNHFDPQFADWVAFLAMSEPVTSYTGDRRGFIGRNGTLRSPAALRDDQLNKVDRRRLRPLRRAAVPARAGPGRDARRWWSCSAPARPRTTRAPCSRVTLPWATPARPCRRTDRGVGPSDSRSSPCETPEPSFDAMVNRWTLYQALACRMWARSALYQSSGAYGFRDQLQDVMAFVYAEPALAREHILRASRAPVPRGRRAALVAPAERARRAHPVLRRPGLAPVRGRPLPADDRRRVGARRVRPLPLHARARARTSTRCTTCPSVTDEHASVYEHCLRALRRACTTGVHGLPLIGTGDWNDGMNRVGDGGPGRERLAGLVPHPHAARLRRAGRRARRRRRGAATSARRADAYAAAVEAHALGRRLVPPRLLRRRHAARLARRATSAASTRSRRAGA